MNTNNTDSQNITWEEVEKYLENDSYKEFIKQIPPYIFNKVLKEGNRAEVTDTILKVLRERDPQNATEEYAQKIDNVMQLLAQKILAERNK